MADVSLKDMAAGSVQEQFQKSFDKVMENLMNPNTPYKVGRAINISIKFTQNEARDDVHCSISVSEKLAPQSPLSTAFSVGKDLKTGKIYAEEYGKQIKGQMTIGDLAEDTREFDTETGEIMEHTGPNVVDFRSVKEG